MAIKDRNLIEQFSNVELLEDINTKKVFSRILLKAFDNADTDEDEKFIGALALKYNLECADEILDKIEIEGFKMPWE